MQASSTIHFTTILTKSVPSQRNELRDLGRGVCPELCVCHAQSSDPEVTISSCAAALGAHYLPGLIAFIFGHQTSFPTQDKWVAIIEQHLEKFEKSGLGYDIRLARSRVESVSGSSAMCFVTWKILPKNGVEGWEWKNVYGYRLGQDGKEGWEFIVSDNEVAGVMQRAPAFFSTT